MAGRALTITVDADWPGALRTAARQTFGATTYQGETLNFETPAAFFGRRTYRRWDLLRPLQGAGELTVRELARRAGGLSAPMKISTWTCTCARRFSPPGQSGKA